MIDKQYPPWGSASSILLIDGKEVFVCIWCHKPCVDHKEPHKAPWECETWYDF